jgi:hypothetical protein
VEFKEESNWKLRKKKGNQRGIKMEFKVEIKKSKWNLKVEIKNLKKIKKHIRTTWDVWSKKCPKF